MPLAVSALQKQIKRYLEACTGVCVEEVRVFVDGTINQGKNAEKSPYAIPAELLGGELTAAEEEAADQETAEEGELVIEMPQEEAAAEAAPAQEEAAAEPAAEEAPASAEETPAEQNEGE